MSKILLKFGVITLLVKLISGQAGFGGSGTSVPGVCVCATAGSCSLAGGGEENDGTGQLDARILNSGATSAPTGSMDNTGLGITGTGIGLVAWTQGACDAAPGLERCCPERGYTCGIRYPPVANSPTPSSGQASFGAYPFQAAILTSSNIYLGAGVAIDQFHVLTAAHKLNVSADAKLKVRMGEWDISQGSEPIPFQEFMVLNVTVHPQYNVGNLKNNIAILTLVTPIPLGQFPTMNNICLPNMTISNMRCMVAGWGKNDPANGNFQNVLREVDLPLVPTAQCQDMLRQNTRLGPNFKLDEQCFLCAGGEAGKDACTGDGGAPLSCYIYDRFYLVGLTAWGIGCGKAGVPGVYVNIQTYIPWIQQIIAAENRMADRLSTTRGPGGSNATSTTTTRRMGGGIVTTTAPNGSDATSTSSVNRNVNDAVNTTVAGTTTRPATQAPTTLAGNASVQSTAAQATSSGNASIIFTTTSNAATTIAPSASNITTSSNTTSSSNSSVANAAATTRAPTSAPSASNVTASSNTTSSGNSSVANAAVTTKPPVANAVSTTAGFGSVGEITSKPGAANATKPPVAGAVTSNNAASTVKADGKTTVKNARQNVKGARRPQ